MAETLKGLYTPEKLAAALWDAREARDPSGERTGCTDLDAHQRAPVFWAEAVERDLWPASRREVIEEARLAIEIAESMPDD